MHRKAKATIPITPWAVTSGCMRAVHRELDYKCLSKLQSSILMHHAGTHLSEWFERTLTLLKNLGSPPLRACSKVVMNPPIAKSSATTMMTMCV